MKIGFTWDEGRWEKILVRVTEVTILEKTFPASGRFIGLRNLETGKVATREDFGEGQFPADHEYVQLNRGVWLPEGSENRKVVETVSKRSGFLGDLARLSWLEPNLTQGLDPAFSEFLGSGWMFNIQVIDVSLTDDKHIYTALLQNDKGEEYTVDLLSTARGQRTIFVQRAEGRTFVAEYDIKAAAERLHKHLLPLERKIRRVWKERRLAQFKD